VLLVSREGGAPSVQGGYATCALNTKFPELPGDNTHRKFQEISMTTNYVTRDNFGMYAGSSSGTGPALMGADTLLGNDVSNKDGESLGDIKDFMIDMAPARLPMQSSRLVACSAWGTSSLPFRGQPWRWIR
jgi:hypothetical protein